LSTAESYSHLNKVSKILYGRGSTEIKRENDASRNRNRDIHSNRNKDVSKQNKDKSVIYDKSPLRSFNIFKTINSNKFGHKSVRDHNNSVPIIHKKSSINLDKKLISSTVKTQLKFYINQTYKTHISANKIVIQNFGTSLHQSHLK
jgi:hypothetical protein